MAFSIAHLSDLHLPVPPLSGLASLASKRLLSWNSWRRSRRHVHRPEVLAALMEDVRAHAPDHLVVTGDLTNLALPEEFSQAADWLSEAGPADRVTVVPGNHDALVPVAWRGGLAHWVRWFGEPAASQEEAFPFVRVRSGVALIGVSTAEPTAPLLATGRIGTDQLQRLETLLRQTQLNGLFRVVLLHHPPADEAVSRRKALSDRHQFRAMLARTGAELVLHGHAHRSRLDLLAGPSGPIASLGIGSASALPGAHGDAASWRRLTLSRDVAGWRLRSEVRRWIGDGRFETVGCWTSQPSVSDRSACAETCGGSVLSPGTEPH